MSSVHSFTTWDEIEIVYREWGQATMSPPVVLELLSGDHMLAIADPRFAAAIVEFLA